MKPLLAAAWMFLVSLPTSAASLVLNENGTLVFAVKVPESRFVFSSVSQAIVPISLLVDGLVKEPQVVQSSFVGGGVQRCSPGVERLFMSMTPDQALIFLRPAHMDGGKVVAYEIDENFKVLEMRYRVAYPDGTLGEEQTIQVSRNGADPCQAGGFFAIEETREVREEVNRIFGVSRDACPEELLESIQGSFPTGMPLRRLIEDIDRLAARSKLPVRRLMRDSTNSVPASPVLRFEDRDGVYGIDLAFWLDAEQRLANFSYIWRRSDWPVFAKGALAD